MRHKKYDYPLNLYNDIFNTDKTEITDREAQMVEWAVDNCLNIKGDLMPRLVILYRYKHQLTLDGVRVAVNKELGVNYVACETHRQMISKALRRLRHPDVSRKIVG